MKNEFQKQLIAARRNQILDAAATVFGEKGFHPTTTKDIARAAGIAEGTIYNYFENKTALLFGILDRMTATIQQGEDFSKIGELDMHSFMQAYLRHPLMALKADNFELFRVIVSEIMVNQEMRTLYYQRVLEPTMVLAEPFFQRWADQHVIKPIDISLTMRAISGMVFGLMLEHIMGDQVLAARWDELPDFLANLLLDGLRSDQV